ncbi:amidohydrolase family protein [Candidatus Bathyarchaeota archaeon]|nr:amidohydrolase family protein [Candidatus Bathyarchaeota archaeon]MBS7631852.1 amidohydrolase family protein [Candidatus Bathyarchaeota archaeon]
MYYDLIIKNGRIVDGAGNPWYRGDVAIAEGKIKDIEDLSGVRGDVVINAQNKIVAPGFIDAHSHADYFTLVFPQLESTVMQGITTVITGQCGGSLAPIDPKMRSEMEKRASSSLPPGIEFRITWETFDEYLKEEEKLRLGVNVAHLVGHGTIRAAAMGFEARDPTPNELKTMKKLTAEAMEAGAFGVSSGLIYPPGIFAKTEELIEVAKVASQYGGVYASHIRGEGVNLLKSVEEAIRIGEEACLPVQISHHKAAHKLVWGKSVETLKLMEEARSRGIDVTFDQYPYRAGATSLMTLLPPWAHDGGVEKMLERLRDPDQVAKMREDIEKGIQGWENFAGELGWESIYVSSVKSEANKGLEGKNLKQIREIRGDPDEFTSLVKILIEEEGSAWMIVFSMDEEDIRRIMKHPLQMVGTDSLSASPTGPMSFGKPHPRYYGTYPRILGTYVREGVLWVEEAVRKMTSMPAQRFGLMDRGLIRPGMNADITVFDPETVKDRATFDNPHQFPEGIDYVIVNGIVTVDKGIFTNNLAGKTIRKRLSKVK